MSLMQEIVHSSQQTYSFHQHTLRHSVTCKGVGIHSGKPSYVRLVPAPVNTGIVFRRVDLPGTPDIPALYTNIINSTLCTKIGLSDEISVATVEHIMAALAAFEIDNVVVEVDGCEVPIMDGSSAPFVALFQCAGRLQQGAPRRYLRVKQPVVVDQGHKKTAFLPENRLTVSFQTLPTNADPLLGGQAYTYVHNWRTFCQEVGAARTVCFHDNIEQLQSSGFGLGGSLDNTVVLKEGKVLNRDGLRYLNEFARHKALDALGDLYLLGMPILADFHSLGGGHMMNALAMKELMVDDGAYEIGTLEELSSTTLGRWEEMPCFVYVAQKQPVYSSGF